MLDLKVEATAEVERQQGVGRVVVRGPNLVRAPVDEAALVDDALGLVGLEGVEDRLLVLDALVDLVAHGELQREPGRAGPLGEQEHRGGSGEGQAQEGQQKTEEREEEQRHGRLHPVTRGLLAHLREGKNE